MTELDERTSASRWKTQRAKSRGYLNSSTSAIHNGDVGIFITCDRGQEAKCVQEIDDILSEYINSHQSSEFDEDATDHVGDGDIEGNIAKELESMKSSAVSGKKPYTIVRLDIACVSFIRMSALMDPVSVVRQICNEACSNASRHRTRYVKRLTPVSCVRKTLDNGLEQLCEAVLRPAFGGDTAAKKFAIRPTIRNNDKLDRDYIIKAVADAVSQLNTSHSVDLKNYDCLILVEVYRNVCGISVVGQEFEKLKRFNLSEIYQATGHEGFLRRNEAS